MSQTAADIVESKADFARRLGVSAGRVSQYISEGKLTAEAFEGEGPKAKVRVGVAMEQLNRRLDVAQRLGNGQRTRIDVTAFAPPAPAAARAPAPEPVTQDPSFVSLADRIQQEKLRELELRNREAAKKELANRGEYVRASDVGVGYARLASGMMNVFEGSLADLAQALAAKFEIPKRDVLHLLRAEFRRIRENGANAARRAAEDLPGLVIDQAAGAAVAGAEEASAADEGEDEGQAAAPACAA